MLGAIIGDVVGSRFEFNNIKTKKFDLFNRDCNFTDDTAMSIAVADICNTNDFSPENVVKKLKYWGRKYPYAGYGGTFGQWLRSDTTKPYNSYGNGSAMRISPIGWFAKSEEEVKKYSKLVTEVTHNHPEGLKGAEVVAMMIFKARNGTKKSELYDYAVSMYPEIKKLKYKDLVKYYYHGEESCQESVPQALYCFLISETFEDCLRTTISIGGDCDTTAAISCAIAEAYYEIPNDIMIDVFKFLPEDMLDVYLEFCEKVE